MGTKKLSRWERAGLSWTGKEREILRKGRRCRPRESYGEIFLKLLHQRPARVDEHGEQVSHSMAAIYKEAQRLGLTKNRRKYALGGLRGITLRGMSKQPCK